MRFARCEGSIVEVAPSILTADFARLGETLEEAVEAGINWMHMDVMDGNWVVNKTITFGPALIRSVRDRLGPDVFIDCHLMTTNAEDTWSQYVDAGVDLVIAHIEAVDDPAALITNLHAADCQAGLVLNPDTSAEAILPYLADLDLVLVMSVIPGKGGQSFMPEVANTTRALSAAIDAEIQGGGRKTKEKVDVLSYELLAYRTLVNPNATPGSEGPNALPNYFISADDIKTRQNVDVHDAAQKWIDYSI